MMRRIVALALILLMSGAAEAKLVEQTVEYTQGGKTFEGFLAYDDEAKGPRPGVLVFHEWWGQNDYIKRRSREVAALGYVAFAPDVYGKGTRPSTPEAAGNEAGKYMRDRALLRERAAEGLDILKKSPLADAGKIAAIGYCFGGAAALELARSGAQIAATVTFHGALSSPAPQDAANINGQVLVLHGAADPFVKAPDMQAFQDSMNKAGVDWRMVSYGGAVHGFTNPANGQDPSGGLAYDERADRRSWEAMKEFLEQAFEDGH